MSGQFTPDWAMIVSVYHMTLFTRDIEDMGCFSVTNTVRVGSKLWRTSYIARIGSKLWRTSYIARVGSKLWRTSYIARVGSKLWRTSYIARVESVSVYGRLLLASKCLTILTTC